MFESFELQSGLFCYDTVSPTLSCVVGELNPEDFFVLSCKLDFPSNRYHIVVFEGTSGDFHANRVKWPTHNQLISQLWMSFLRQKQTMEKNGKQELFVIVLVQFFSHLLRRRGRNRDNFRRKNAAIMCCEASFASSDTEHIYTARWLCTGGTGRRVDE